MSDASKLEEGHAIDTSSRASKHQHGWRRLVRNFTPSWFAVNMGTGIVSILLHNLPYKGRCLQYISYVVFSLNVLLFVLFLLLSTLRYTLYPRIWVAMIQHPAQSLFLGCCPMGLATIINMIFFVCVPAWGGAWWRFAWVLWSNSSQVNAQTKPLLTPPASDAGSQTSENGREDDKNDHEMFSALEKPRTRYDVEVITKLTVYAGIGWLPVVGNPMLFELCGLA